MNFSHEHLKKFTSVSKLNVKQTTNLMKAIILSSVAGMQSVNAQQSFSISDYKFTYLFEQGFEMLLTGDYNKALPFFATLYRSDTANANLCYLTGFCLYKMRQEPAVAIELLKKASRSVSHNYQKGYSTESKAPPLTFYYLGEMLFMEGDFQESLAAYLKYIALLPHWQVRARNETQLMITTVESAINDNRNFIRSSTANR